LIHFLSFFTLKKNLKNFCVPFAPATSGAIFAQIEIFSTSIIIINTSNKMPGKLSEKFQQLKSSGAANSGGSNNGKARNNNNRQRTAVTQQQQRKSGIASRRGLATNTNTNNNNNTPTKGGRRSNINRPNRAGGKGASITIFL
jgi:hypothetical protein